METRDFFSPPCFVQSRHTEKSAAKSLELPGTGLSRKWAPMQTRRGCARQPTSTSYYGQSIMTLQPISDDWRLSPWRPVWRHGVADVSCLPTSLTQPLLLLHGASASLLLWVLRRESFSVKLNMACWLLAPTNLCAVLSACIVLRTCLLSQQRSIYTVTRNKRENFVALYLGDSRTI